MAQEIERKFLVSGEFKSLATSHSRIVQGYISSARGRTVRVRIRDDKGYLTIKGASNASGTSRYEWEKELPLEEAEELMKADVKTPQQFRLQRHLQAIQNEYDYCIIDSSPSISIINVNGLVAADEVYVPLRCDGGSLLGVAIIMNLFEAVSEYNSRLKMGGMFFTQWNGRKNVSKTVYELLSDMFGDYILPIMISSSKNLEESSLVQTPLLAYDTGKNKCKATQDYLALTEFILQNN